MKTKKTLWSRWLTTQNAKDLGTLYLLLSALMLFLSCFVLIVLRVELYKPGFDLMTQDVFDALSLFYNLIVILGTLLPAFIGLSLWQVPMMIGSDNVYYPRLNRYSFWIASVALCFFILSALFQETTLFVISIGTLGLTSLLSAIIFILTIARLRIANMTISRMPLFIWSVLLTSLLLILTMPTLFIAIIVWIVGPHGICAYLKIPNYNTGPLFHYFSIFFEYLGAALLLIPSLGILIEIIPTFCRRALFSRLAVIYTVILFALLLLITTVHYTLVSGTPLKTELFCSYTLLFVIIPLSIAILNGLGILYRGAIHFTAPMLFATGSILLLTVGGFSELTVNIIVAPEVHTQTPYTILAEFGYVLFPTSIMGFIAAIYYWMPKWTGYFYEPSIAKWHFWLTSLAFTCLFFPSELLESESLAIEQVVRTNIWTDLNHIAFLGIMLLVFSQILFIVNILYMIWKKGSRAKKQVWENAKGLEWLLTSPPHHHRFVIEVD